MTYAAITGWGKCMPPAVLSNADIATFLDTSDEWIFTRTGMRERRRTIERFVGCIARITRPLAMAPSRAGESILSA